MNALLLSEHVTAAVVSAVVRISYADTDAAADADFAQLEQLLRLRRLFTHRAVGVPQRVGEPSFSTPPSLTGMPPETPARCPGCNSELRRYEATAARPAGLGHSPVDCPLLTALMDAVALALRLGTRLTQVAPR